MENTPFDGSRAYVTTPQAAGRSKLSRAYLTMLLNRGKLEGFRLAREWFIYTDSLEQFLSQERKPGPRGPRKKKALAEPPDNSSSDGGEQHVDTP